MPAPTTSRRTALLRVAGALAISLLAGAAQAQPAAGVDVLETRASVEAGKAILIDIREPEETARGVAPGARRLPMSQLEQRFAEIPRDGKQPVLLICATQNRSRKVAQLLNERGYSHVRYVVGGMTDWAQRGLPMVKPQ